MSRKIVLPVGFTAGFSGLKSKCYIYVSGWHVLSLSSACAAEKQPPQFISVNM